MHIILKPVLSLFCEFERFDRDLGAAGFSLKVPFLSVSVFYNSSDMLLASTFRYAIRRKQFVVVGSDEFYDALKTEFAETISQHEESTSKHWDERTKLRNQLAKCQAENHALRSVIKIVSEPTETENRHN